VPLIKSYYEKHVTDAKLLAEGIAAGKYLEGRIFFDKNVPDKHDGFVKVDGVDKAIKVMGLQNLNRALHLDTVVIKLQNWVCWEPAQNKITKHIDFNEMPKILPPVAEEIKEYEVQIEDKN